MNYAVIETGGKQYRISEGQTLDVDNLNLSEGDSVTFDKVLLYVNNGNVVVGTPYLSNVTVRASVVENRKGEKVIAARFKAKSNYHRVSGFRPYLTRVTISDIKLTDKKEKETKKANNE